MYLEDVLKLRRGAVVPLEKMAGDPVDIFVNGRLIARGEVLVMNDNWRGLIVNGGTAHQEMVRRTGLACRHHPVTRQLVLRRDAEQRRTAAREVANVMEQLLALEMIRVTEAAAIESARFMGRGERDAADAAATEAMRRTMDEIEFAGRIVIGEGERDEAPMLYIGERDRKSVV